MIWKLIAAWIGYRGKEKVVDAILDVVDLPGPTEAAIKAAATGNAGDLLAEIAKKPKKPAVKK